jgi:hypothetical protein
MHRHRRMGSAPLWCAVLLAGFWPGKEVRATNTVSGGIELQSFNWKEQFGDDLELEESGALFGLSLLGRKDYPSPLALHYRVLGYGGTVDYDGFLMSLDGGIAPYASETSYLGLAGDLDVSYHLASPGEWELRPFVGFGSAGWLRSLDNTEGYGYDEYWLSLAGRAGLRVDVEQNDRLRWHLMAALVAPFRNFEWVVDVPLAPDSTIELTPKNEIGYQLDAGFTYQRWTLSVYYEAMDFGQSDLDDSGLFFQPASERRVAGLRLGRVL